ncbi:enhancer of mRNA-decapping protein 4 homolog Ge-1 isoform X3 [Amblyomma americanum]
MSSHEGSIDANEATRLLKDILHLGKSPSAPSEGVEANGGLDEAAGGGGDPTDGMAAGGNLLESIFRSSQENQQEIQQSQQQICLLDNEEDVSVDVCGKEVQVVVSRMHGNASSNRVKIKNVVDYSWELKYNYGKHICLHMSGAYLAYALRAANSSAGVVRVLNLKTGQRLLVKGFRGPIQDMAFAWLATTVMLAVVDVYGTLCVYSIDNDTSSTLLFKVERPPDEVPSEYRRVVWCPYVPDDGSRGGNSAEDDNSKVLVATNLEEAEVWNVGCIVAEYGMRTLTVPEVRIGLQRIIEHTKPIIDAAFAPDGTALATAGADGQVRFFQVYMQEPDASPRCLHQWCPHNEKPVTCLFFLDNMKACNPETQFWKYALTGTDHNTELKLWSCETWACLQTIRFIVSPVDRDLLPAFKVEIDPTACYVVLSDVHRKVVYVGQLQLDNKAELVSLALFPVTLPVLSFAVVEAVRCRYKPSTDTEHVDRLDAESEEADSADEERTFAKTQEGTMVRLYWMTTKSIQACHIVYPLTASSALSSAVSLGTLSQNSTVSGCTDHLSDVSADADDDEKAGQNKHDADVPSQKGKVHGDDDSSGFAEGKVLLKPSDFVSPSNSSTAFNPCTAAASTNTDPLPPTTSPCVRNTSTPVPGELCCNPMPGSLASPGAASGVLDLSRKGVGGDAAVAKAATTNGDCELSDPPQRKLSQRSTASSSSQEVADIMAPSEMLANADETHPGETEAAAHEPSLLTPPASEGQEVGDAGWPRPPEKTEGFHVAPTTTTVCDQEVGADPLEQDQNSAHALSRLELLISQHLEENNALTQTVGTLSSQLREDHAQLQKLQEWQSHEKDLVSSLLAECKANRTSFARLENAISKLTELQKVGVEKQSTMVAQSLDAMLGINLEKFIANEFKITVVPSIVKIIDLTRCEISGRLETTEALIKESTIKAVKSKAMFDAVAQATSTSIQSHVETTCRDILENVLMPSLDRLCHSLFSQLGEIFQKGTREFLHQAQEHIDKHNQEQVAEAMKKVQSDVERSLQTFLRDHQAALVPPDFRAPFDEAVNNALQGLETGLLQALTGQQEKLMNSLKEEMHGVLKESVAAAVAEGAASRSKMATPVPFADPHLLLQQITLLMRQGQYNMAFQQALSVADLATVVSTCEMVSPTSIFGQHPCPLQQPVLLSLIQQLCADLSSSSEIKLKYLEEAVLSLDKENAITKEHMKVILSQLCLKLNNFIMGTASHDLGRMARRLLMVTQSLLNS